MASRVKILAKLGLLIGGPLAVLMSIFGTGIYCGVNSQHGVLTFERDVLGMDVKVPEEPARDGNEAKADEKKPDEKKADENTPTPPADSAGGQPAPTPTVTPTPTPTVTPTPTPVVAPTPAPNRFPVALPEPIDDAALTRQLSSLRTLEVKVFVDPDLVAQRGDWVAYASQLVDAASGSYKNLFGIELRLVGVVKWEAATAALGRDQMLEDLRARPAEGADLLVGLTAQSIDHDRGGARMTDEEHNAAFGVVYADTRGMAPHLRPLLRELGRMFGAPDLTDVQSDAYQRGSWMSQAPVPEGSTPWVDPESRRRILERKDLPMGDAS